MSKITKKNKKSSQAWKKAEKDTAKILKGRRNQRVKLEFTNSVPDIDHFLLVPEIKHGYKFPKYLYEWFKEVEKYDNPDDKIRCVIWGGKNKRTKDKIVMIKLEEFAKLLYKIKNYDKKTYKYELNKLIEDVLLRMSSTVNEIEKVKKKFEKSE